MATGKLYLEETMYELTVYSGLMKKIILIYLLEGFQHFS